MKVHILFPIKAEPSGGGNQFLAALREQLRARSLYSERADDADVILFNSYPFGHAWTLYQEVIRLKTVRPSVKVIHRVDGPIAVVRGHASDLLADQSIALFNEALADATVYQSEWSARLCKRLWLGRTHATQVIGNAPDARLFHALGRPVRAPGKVRIIASSWSSNWRKGFDIYRWLDAHLDFSRFEFTFVGNSPVKFQRIRHVPPVGSEPLAHLLREHDLYLTASVDDPCSNALMEALACGLPAVARRSGGHPEMVGSRGVLFDGTGDVITAIDTATASLAALNNDVHAPSIEHVTDRYVDFARHVVASAVDDDRPGNLHARQRGLMLSVLRERWALPIAKRLSSILPIRAARLLKVPDDVLRHADWEPVASESWGRSEAETWVRGVWGRVPIFLDNLRHPSDLGLYRYSLSGDLHPRPSLASSVFVAKVRAMSGLLDDQERAVLSRHLLSYQAKDGAMADPWVGRHSMLYRSALAVWTRDGNNLWGQETVRAETRQSFAALAALGFAPERPFAEIPSDARQTQSFVTSLNWERPWGAASHISHLVFFLTWHQRWFPDRAGGGVSAADVLADVEARYRQSDGSWHAPGAQVSPSNKVNGAMKMVTALDAVGQAQLSNPEGLIDLCLSVVNDGHACNHFNVICVLHRCIQLTEHRRAEVEQYLLRRLSLYRQHYWPWSGGFSFFPSCANDRYYGARVSRGMPEPDIHGTVLMVWGIVLICEALGLCQDLYMQRPIT